MVTIRTRLKTRRGIWLLRCFGLKTNLKTPIFPVPSDLRSPCLSGWTSWLRKMIYPLICWSFNAANMPWKTWKTKKEPLQIKPFEHGGCKINRTERKEQKEGGPDNETSGIRQAIQDGSGKTGARIRLIRHANSYWIRNQWLQSASLDQGVWRIWRKCVPRAWERTFQFYIWSKKAAKTGQRIGNGEGSIKKTPGLLESKECVRFQFLKEHQKEYNIQKDCKILGMSRSGFYDYLKRRKSNRAIENEALTEMIEDIFHEHQGRYGARRIQKVLEQQNVHEPQTCF